MIKLSLGYPSVEDEITIVLKEKQAKADIQPVTDGPTVVGMIDLTQRVIVSPEVASYIVHIVTATRSHPDIQLGSSPRGSISIYELSRAYALLQGRNFVEPGDVKYVAPYVLGHRITLTHAAKTEKRRPEDVIESILGGIVVPAEPEKKSQWVD